VRRRDQAQAPAAVSGPPAGAPAAAFAGAGEPPSPVTSVRRTFPGEPGQVRRVRDFIRRYLADDHNCPAGAIEDVLVCVTELATNAISHSRSGAPGGHFTVQVDVWPGGQVRVAVGDDGGPWRERETACDADCGRGLRIVCALSDRMGITGGNAGRTAWFCSPGGSG
jgi:anti-sigma regulatory factor (Ser/Thr protein kinase)